jgi:restriction system protein
MASGDVGMEIVIGDFGEIGKRGCLLTVFFRKGWIYNNHQEGMNMTIPTYEEMMLPLLEFAGDKKVHTIEESLLYITRCFNISPEDTKQLLRSGKQSIVSNRVGWARTYLKKAGLLESQERAKFNITPLGLKILSEKPISITDKYLMQFESFQEFQKRHGFPKGDNNTPGKTSKTPLEELEDSYLTLRSDLADELLSSIAKCTPAFFEKLVVELLVAMGYGGSFEDAGYAIGKSGDGGIDGIIKEDRLGLDEIYVQAKRWEGVVGSKEIRNFVGALAGQKASKGVFITTSSFTKDALSYVQAVTSKVILVDGQQLAQLMIDFGIGVSLEKNYQIKRVDHDYFEV